MKNIQTLKAAALVAFTMASGAVTAQAQIAIQTVTVGNIDNAADTVNPNPGFGAVAYEYQIGKYEVTNTQYVAFLNSVAATDTFSLYNTDMAGQFGGITRANGSGSFSYATKTGFENKPVNFVSFWDATRFANWQSGGVTETGSYTLTSDGISANTVTRNVGANWVVASENEWYKAAYYDPTKSGGAGYWLHATKSDTLGQNNPFTDTNGANYDEADGDYANGGISGPGTTDVGSYTNAGSFYGTFDQAGNLGEWNESINSDTRVLRGGAWILSEYYLRSSFRFDFDASGEGGSIGFRVVSLAPATQPMAPIPEPGTFGLMGVVVLGAFTALRRKARGTC